MAPHRFVSDWALIAVILTGLISQMEPWRCRHHLVGGGLIGGRACTSLSSAHVDTPFEHHRRG